MLAVIKLSGSQHLVKKDDVLQVNKLEVNVGDEISTEEVLSVMDNGSIKIGEPFVEGSSVKYLVLDQGKGKKVIVFKKKRRKNHRKKNGHRQHLTTIKILDVK